MRADMMIDGNTQIIAHIGYPTETFKAPMIYNPYFESIGVNAAVVPMGVKAQDYRDAFRSIFRFTNVCGALITMPHKISTVDMLDSISPAVRIAGSCNAVRKSAHGELIGDMFDGEGFVRGVIAKGRRTTGANVFIAGCGGVGSAIAASFAMAGAAHIHLFDPNTVLMENLAARILAEYPDLELSLASADPDGFEIVVNATPLGMNRHDPMPIDVTRIAPTALVGDVVMKQEITGFLLAAQARGCQTQIGIDMLFEQIPAYLEFFGFPSPTAQALRGVARVSY
jgi:shikimate dehydrogenase